MNVDIYKLFLKVITLDWVCQLFSQIAERKYKILFTNIFEQIFIGVFFHKLYVPFLASLRLNEEFLWFFQYKLIDLDLWYEYMLFKSHSVVVLCVIFMFYVLLNLFVDPYCSEFCGPTDQEIQDTCAYRVWYSALSIKAMKAFCYTILFVTFVI